MFVVLTDENFEKEILQAEKPVLVDFWMENCFPCTLLAPILEKLAGEKEFGEKILFAKVNFSAALLTIQKYGLRAAPSVILFKEGKPTSGFVGLRQEEEIRQWLKDFLNDNEEKK